MPSLSEFRANQPVYAKIRWGRLREAGEPLLAALAFAVTATLTNRFWEVYQQNVDEAYNLMKAALVASGYALFSEIWSDQPPVFTYVLVPLQWLSPGNVDASRVLVLAFASWIIFSLFRIVRRFHGSDAAWISVLALTASFTFSLISVYVLIGLPAVAFAMAGIDHALVGAARQQRWRFVLAGVLVGLGLQTKLFTTLMLPTVILAAFVGAAGTAALRRAAANAALLALSIAATFLAIALITGEALFAQLIEPHAQAGTVEKYVAIGGPQLVWHSLRPQLALLAVPLGLIVVATRRRLADILPLVWLCIAVPVMVLHRPYWGHHAIMILVPAAWLSGIGLGLFTSSAYRRAAAASATIVLLISAAVTISALYPDRPRRLPHSPFRSENTDFRKWAVADYVMDAYRAKWLVPPELAVFSEKRILAGMLPDEELIEVFNRYQPQEILFRRFRPSGEIASSLQKDYQPASSRGTGFLHAVRRPESAVRPEIRREEVVAALTIAAADIASRSIGGGYPANANLKTGQMFGRSLEQDLLLDDEITTRPLGSTQEVGQCFRKIEEMTNDELFGGLAVFAGKALACSQRNAGGWSTRAIVSASCAHSPADDENRPMTIDDRATPVAIGFLLDLNEDFRKRGENPPSWLKPAIGAALESLLLAQSPDGGWPQTFPQRSDEYAAKYTFNDGAISSVIETLLKAYQLLGDTRYRDAALRGGAFILATQGKEQNGWAQQYDPDLKPASARKFEPAGYSSRETGDVMNTLLDLYVATGDERFATAVSKARAWLEASEIRNDTWARLYEIGTNRPIYGDRDGSVHYALSEISVERQQGYEWEGGFASVLRAVERDDARILGGIEGLKAFDARALDPAPLSIEDLDQLAALVQQINAEGRWAEGNIVSTATFVKNCAFLTRALADLP